MNSDDVLQLCSSQHIDHHSAITVEPSVSFPGSSPVPLESEKHGDYSTSKNDPLSLLDIERLKTMPADQLEKTVANLLRDSHFVSLLENIDSLWKVKGLLKTDKKI